MSKFGYDLGRGVAIDAEGNVVVVGTVLGGDGFSTMAWIAKHDPEGVELWTWQGLVIDMGSAVARSRANAVGIAPDKTIVVVGQHDETEIDDAWVMKLTP